MTDAAQKPPTTPVSPRVARERLIVVALLVGLAVLAISRGAIDRDSVIFIAVIVPSVILHEISHGAVAYLFGDDTAKRAGRLTLNPLVHIDPMGTIVMPTLLALAHATPFGFAKPVPVNVGKLRHPRNESLLVSLAGPATNYTLALLAAAAWRFGNPHGEIMGTFLLELGIGNVFLGTFNLLPVPPLDGSGLLERILPESMWPGYLQFRRYSMVLVFFVVFGFPGVIEKVANPVYRVWLHLAGLHFSL
ncbi:MAG TPA: site-2 protease family protein [Acidimicrobiales bacterium]|nr:site-2 protease family protein [Acidimicrobiales bacterium]